MISGVQGCLEYTALEKVEIDFGDDSAAAVVEYATLDETWNRINRNLRRGNRSSWTDQYVRRKRMLRGMELGERLARVKPWWIGFDWLVANARLSELWIQRSVQVAIDQVHSFVVDRLGALTKGVVGILNRMTAVKSYSPHNNSYSNSPHRIAPKSSIIPRHSLFTDSEFVGNTDLRAPP